MTRSVSLDIQSVIYLNAAEDLVRAAEFTSNAARYAMEKGLLGRWRLLLGDCSPEAVLDTSQWAKIFEFAQNGGGTAEYRPFDENLGSAAGQNRLAENGDSEFLLILNPDALPAYDAIANLLSAWTEDVGIVEARQLPLEHPKDYDPATGETSWASTACALTPRLAFDRLTGFDSETFFLYCDDVDYSWRLRLEGFKVLYEPAARLFHDKRLTQTGDWPSSQAERYFSAEAALLLAHKYSRPDLLREIVGQMERDPSVDVQKALAAFRERLQEGKLPEPIDAEHAVAQFVNGNYAVHRF